MQKEKFKILNDSLNSSLKFGCSLSKCGQHIFFLTSKATIFKIWTDVRIWQRFERKKILRNENFKENMRHFQPVNLINLLSWTFHESNYKRSKNKKIETIVVLSKKYTHVKKTCTNSRPKMNMDAYVLRIENTTFFWSIQTKVVTVVFIENLWIESLIDDNPKYYRNICTSLLHYGWNWIEPAIVWGK